VAVTGYFGGQVGLGPVPVPVGSGLWLGCLGLPGSTTNPHTAGECRCANMRGRGLSAGELVFVALATWANAWLRASQCLDAWIWD